VNVGNVAAVAVAPGTGVAAGEGLGVAAHPTTRIADMARRRARRSIAAACATTPSCAIVI